MKGSACGYIPVRTENIEWTADENGIVTIFKENKGFFNRAMQFLMKKPKRSFIRLDEKGSFFWLNTNGIRTIGEIAASSSEKFGDPPETGIYAAERFLEILCGCGFCSYRK